MARRKKKKDSGLKMFLAGAAAATAIGTYFFYGKDAQKHRRKLKSWTVKAKGEVMEKVERLKQIDAEQYQKFVDQVAKKYKKLKSVDAKDVEKFAQELKRQWKQIERDMKPKVKAKAKTASTRAKKNARKAVRKAARTALKKTARK